VIWLGGGDMFTFLKELTEIKGPSGFEDDVREYIKSKIKDKVDEVLKIGWVISSLLKRVRRVVRRYCSMHTWMKLDSW